RLDPPGPRCGPHEPRSLRQGRDAGVRRAHEERGEDGSPRRAHDCAEEARQAMITHATACELIEGRAEGLADLVARAGELRDRGRGRTVTFSAKVFVPLTTLCRDYCGYCTFRRDPGEPGARTLTPDEVVALAQAGARLGAKEALFSLGDRPEA